MMKSDEDAGHKNRAVKKRKMDATIKLMRHSSERLFGLHSLVEMNNLQAATSSSSYIIFKMYHYLMPFAPQLTQLLIKH